MSSNNSKEFNMQPAIFSHEYERQDSIINMQTEDLRITSAIQRMRTLLERQSVIVPDHCDQFIMRCLRVKDYDEEKTVNLLKNFGIMMRMEEMQDVFEQFKPSLYKDFYYSGIMTPLSKRDLKGRLVLLGRIVNWKPDGYNFDQALAATIVLFNYCVAKSIETQRCGVAFVLDFRGWNFQQIRAMKIGRLKIAVKLLQDSCPGKLKGFHIMYSPKIVNLVYALVSPFLKKKLTSRIHFHRDESSIHQFISPEVLPEILGGVAPNDSYADEDFINELLTTDKYNHDMVTFGYPSC